MVIHVMVYCLQATLDRVGLRGNTTDLSCQPFYKFIEKTYAWHVVGMFALLYAFGGFPAMVWGGALRVAWVYHITWFVNSASHVWGYQTYNTGASSLELCKGPATGPSRGSPQPPCLLAITGTPARLNLTSLVWMLHSSLSQTVQAHQADWQMCHWSLRLMCQQAASFDMIASCALFAVGASWQLTRPLAVQVTCPATTGGWPSWLSARAGTTITTLSNFLPGMVWSGGRLT